MSVFHKEYEAAKGEYPDHQAARTEWEKIYGKKGTDSMIIRDRLRQKEQIVKARKAGRVHQAKQNDKGVWND